MGNNFSVEEILSVIEGDAKAILDYAQRVRESLAQDDRIRARGQVAALRFRAEQITESVAPALLDAIAALGK